MSNEKDLKSGKEGSHSDENLKFGWLGFNPRWLQWANNIFAYSILMTLLHTFSSGTTNGLAGVMNSSIERRFQFTSQQSSLIIVAYEIFGISISILTTWLGTVGCHRPRWVAAGSISYVVGCLLYALPHFTSDVYQPGGIVDDEEDFLCRDRTNGTNICKGDDEPTDPYAGYMAFFVLARMCFGFAGSAMHSLGVTFMDDCLSKEKFSLYSAIFALGGLVGPALGFIGGALCLELYTEWPNIDGDDIGLDPSDPRWVGAWWLPFLIFAVFLALLFVPLSGYPPDLPGASEVRRNKSSEAFNAKKDEKPEDMTNTGFQWKDLAPYTKETCTNWTFIFLSLYICCDMSIIAAFTVFGPKYVEVQFSLTATQAGILFGLLVIPAGLFGTIGGGVIIDRFKLTLKQIIQFEFGMSIMVVATGFVAFLLNCGQVQFAGVNSPYPIPTTSDLNITDSCNIDCMCEDLPYSPVCSHDGIQYFSPCRAGCSDRYESDGMEFFNCSCITSPEDPTESQGSWSICENNDCTGIPLFSVMLFFAMLGLFMSESMNISAVYRSVPNKHRVYATFLTGFIIRFFGSIPGPLLMAACFDSSCLLWQERCGSRGSCFYYDNDQLGNYVLAYAATTKVASIFFIFFAFWLYKPPSIVEDESHMVEVADVKDDLNHKPNYISHDKMQKYNEFVDGEMCTTYM